MTHRPVDHWIRVKNRTSKDPALTVTLATHAVTDIKLSSEAMMAGNPRRHKPEESGGSGKGFRKNFECQFQTRFPAAELPNRYQGLPLVCQARLSKRYGPNLRD